MIQVEKLTFKEMQRKIHLEQKPYQEITLNEMIEMGELQLRYLGTK